MRWIIHSSFTKQLLNYLYCAILLLPVLAMPLQPQELASDTTALAAVVENTGDSKRDQVMSDFIFRVSWVTLLIVGMLFAIAALLRRRNIMGTVSQDFQIMERRMINQKQSVIIVKVEGRRLLLGCTDQQIQLLTELEPVKDGPVYTEESSGEKKEFFKEMMGLLK